ncbi:MAG: hypothetical protein ACR2OI_00955 [Acidimicrobiia bacterium]
MTSCVQNAGSSTSVQQRQLLQELVDMLASQRVMTPQSFRVTDAGTVDQGALSIAVQNTGGADAQWNGATLEPGYGISHEFVIGHVYGAIAYDATGTALMIEVNRYLGE